MTWTVCPSIRNSECFAGCCDDNNKILVNSLNQIESLIDAKIALALSKQNQGTNTGSNSSGLSIEQRIQRLEQLSRLFEDMKRHVDASVAIVNEAKTWMTTKLSAGFAQDHNITVNGITYRFINGILVGTQP